MRVTLYVFVALGQVLLLCRISVYLVVGRVARQKSKITTRGGGSHARFAFAALLGTFLLSRRFQLSPLAYTSIPTSLHKDADAANAGFKIVRRDVCHTAHDKRQRIPALEKSKRSVV